MSTQPPVSVTGDASLIRPKFSAGLVLEDDDLTRAVDFTRALNTLLLRAMLGAGVLCGLKVEAQLDRCCVRVTIKRGVAVDCSGAVIELPFDASLTFDLACEHLAVAATYAVVISRTQRGCAQRDLSCFGDDDTASVATRLLDGYLIEVVKRDPDNPNQDAAWSRRQQAPADGDCPCDCGNAPKPVLLAKIDYIPKSETAPSKVGVRHGERNYIRPALAPDPLPDAEAAPGAAAP